MSLARQIVQMHISYTGYLSLKHLQQIQKTSLLVIQPSLILSEQKITFYLTLLVHLQGCSLLEKIITDKTGTQVLGLTESRNDMWFFIIARFI